MLSKIKKRFGDHNAPSFLLLFFIFIIGRLAAYYRISLADDAFITFRYAINLVEGRGFVFHNGEWVLSTTTPLFGLFCALVYALGFDLVKVMPIMGIVFDAISLFLICTFFLKGQDNLLKAIFCAAFIMVPTMRVSVTGMEASFFVCVILLSFLCAAKEKYTISALLATASVFIRPEGVLVFGTIFAVIFFRKEYKKLLRFCGVTLMALLPILVIMNHYYGSILPQSVIVKSGHIFSKIPEWKPSTAHYFFYSDYAIIALSVLSFLGIRHAFLSKEISLKYLSIFALLYLLSYLVASPWIFLWYLFPYHVVACIWAAFGAQSLIKKYRIFQPFKNSTLVLSFGVLCTLLCYGIFFPSTYENGRIKENWHDAVGKKIQEFCDEKKPESILTMCDLGRLAYYCKDTYFYDSCGLASKESIQLHDPEILVQLMHSKKPEYIAFFAYKGALNNREKLNLIPKDRYTPLFEVPYLSTGETLSSKGGGLIIFERTP